MISSERQYLNLLQDILDNGYSTDDRTGTGTKSVFGRQLRFNLQDGFPLLTTKKVFWKGVVIELLWLLRGETNVKFLNDYGVTIWDEWKGEDGDLGPVYGKQWRDWDKYNTSCGKYYTKESIDQIKNVIQRIKDKPTDRRLIVSAWNPADVDTMALPPCHCFFQFKVYGDTLHCQLYQRSADVFLGVPFNIASYALLTHLIANECGLKVGEFIHTFGDVHIYNNHIEQVKEQLTRVPLNLPTLSLNIPQGELLNFVTDCHKYPWVDGVYSIQDAIKLNNYNSHAPIKAEVSV